jgi:sortase (surface protein transpeptidase)
MRGKRGRHASRAHRLRRPWAAVTLAAGLVLICAATAGLTWASQTREPVVPAGRTPFVPVPRGHWAAAPLASAEPVATPVSLSIPAIGVQTALVRLGLTSAGALQVPASTSTAGWYTASPRPGQTGAAVIAGHVDSRSGPAVFFRLRLLRPGELIYVRRMDGSLAVFRVSGVREYDKSEFPTAAVYGPVPDAELRLITCGGAFDQATGHYVSNVIVSATLDPGGTA